MPIAAVVIVMLAAVPARGSEYIGLWKVDRDGDGVALDFPDNGFDGACARFSGGGEGEGQVRVESQMVRFRFDRVTMKAGGNVDPQNVHVQVSVKGKTAWTADEVEFSDVPLDVELGGYELVLEAKKLSPGAEAWEVGFCGMAFHCGELAVRFTSDCAGFDVVPGAGQVSIVPDEDWYSLGWEMAGGMAAFLDKGSLPAPRVAGAPVPVAVLSTYPSKHFFVAVGQNGKPVLEPEEGTSGTVSVDPGIPGELELAVKAKTTLKGEKQWGATFVWAGAAPVVEPSPEGEDIVSAGEEDGGGGGGGTSWGCGVGPRGMGAAWLWLVAALCAIVRSGGCKRA